LIRARVTNEHDHGFVYQQTLTDGYDAFVRITSQRSGQPGINAAEYAGFEFYAPNKSEQTQIGNLFQKLDDLIALHQRKRDLLKQQKQAFLHCMFPKPGATEPELRFRGFNEPWQRLRWDEVVGRLTSQSSDEAVPRLEFEDLVAGEGVLNRDITTKKDNRKGIPFQQNDILFGKLRPYLQNWLFADFVGIAVGDFWVFRAQPRTDPRFIYYLMQGNDFQSAAALSSGTKMPRSNWNTVSATVLSIPRAIVEQAYIGEFFLRLDDRITAEAAVINRIQTLKRALLRQMFV